jgi:uncharacterized protein YdeI (YjbR/CyaY-like superfamily)
MLAKGAMMDVDITYFATPAEFRAWFEAHHETETELWVGFHKKGSGLPSITWPESVDEALCFGWIDAVRKSVSETAYMIRFTRRKPSSIWSAINIDRVAVLTEEGRMRPAGLAAFAARREDKSRRYAYEQGPSELDAEATRQFQANERAWAFFQSRPPWYQRNATWWVISAKREETRQKRLATLIADSEAGKTIAHLTPPGKQKPE